jgi:hypothetical protein
MNSARHTDNIVMDSVVQLALSNAGIQPIILWIASGMASILPLSSYKLQVTG